MKSVYIVKPTSNKVPEWITNICNQYKKLYIKEINYPADSSDSHLMNIIKVINDDENVEMYIYIPTHYYIELKPNKNDTIIKGSVVGSRKAIYLTRSKYEEATVEKFINDYV